MLKFGIRVSNSVRLFFLLVRFLGGWLDSAGEVAEFQREGQRSLNDNMG